MPRFVPSQLPQSRRSERVEFIGVAMILRRTIDRVRWYYNPLSLREKCSVYEGMWLLSSPHHRCYQDKISVDHSIGIRDTDLWWRGEGAGSPSTNCPTSSFWWGPALSTRRTHWERSQSRFWWVLGTRGGLRGRIVLALNSPMRCGLRRSRGRGFGCRVRTERYLGEQLEGSIWRRHSGISQDSHH